MALTTTTRRKIRIARDQLQIDWHGAHGANHWAVRENGLKLAAITGAKVEVVELFSLLHDTQRENEYVDPEHGWRAARFAEKLAGDVFQISREDLNHLVLACEGHSDGEIEADLTVATCWDADRLDLGRVGIRPRPERLCTAVARDPEMIAWAYDRSIRHHYE